MAKTKKKRKVISVRITKGAVVRISRDINIIVNPKPKVVPGVAHVFNGQLITWWNSWRNPVLVAVPAGIDGAPFLLTIPSGLGQAAPGLVNGPRGDDIIYFVIDAVTGLQIHGNSPPEIIIE